MKLCKKCGVEKSEDDFYWQFGKPRTYCKSCFKAAWHEYRTANKEKYYIHNNIGKQKYRSLYPERIYAQRALSYAIRSGLINKPNQCEQCGTECKPQGHHPDYAKPRNVVFLCPLCYKHVHSNYQTETILMGKCDDEKA